MYYALWQIWRRLTAMILSLLWIVLTAQQGVFSQDGTLMALLTGFVLGTDFCTACLFALYDEWHDLRP